VEIRDIMNPNVISVTSATSLTEAAEVLRSSQASDLMVVDGDQLFAGVLSEGDLLRAAMPGFEDVMFNCGSVSGAFQSFVEEGQVLSHATVNKLVISHPVVVRPYNHPLRAAAIMVSRQIRRLPVVDDDGTLVGTISRADIASVIIRP
jgi:CBS domain-containing protein